MSYFKYWIGKWRILWGLCPLCNSDAPEIDTCNFCMGRRSYRDRRDRQIVAICWVDLYYDSQLMDIEFALKRFYKKI